MCVEMGKPAPKLIFMTSLYAPPALHNTQRWKRLRVGLFGGSFNPPHAGHAHVSHSARVGLQLDFVWWLVTPQNPNKVVKPTPMAERIAQCEALAPGRHTVVSGIEEALGTRITYDSLKALKIRFPHIDFVWISGMDNALGMHEWHHWRELLTLVPFVHLTREPAPSLVQSCPLRLYKRQTHRIINKAGLWPLKPGTSYWMMQKKMVNISSSAIRNKTLKNQ